MKEWNQERLKELTAEWSRNQLKRKVEQKSKSKNAFEGEKRIAMTNERRLEIKKKNKFQKRVCSEEMDEEK